LVGIEDVRHPLSNPSTLFRYARHRHWHSLRGQRNGFTKANRRIQGDNCRQLTGCRPIKWPHSAKTSIALVQPVNNDDRTEQNGNDMDVIHFTERAADPLDGFDATGALFVPLLEGQGNSHVSCLHLDSNARISSPSLTHAAALLCVHGRITVQTQSPTIRIDIHAGMGCAFDAGEPYTIEFATGAIVIIVESDCLTAHERGISTPARIAGARWPGDSVGIGA
jgi:hypothetical protein